jgi:hypothetical protein
MHPSSIMPYYPKYSVLDEVVARNQYHKLIIYIDLKNCLKGIYLKDIVVNILESSNSTQFIDTSIFSSLISFIAYHKMYAHKRGVSFDFIIFFEMGTSSYHQNIDKNYKRSRTLDDFFGLKREKRERFTEILQANFQLIERACNRMPHIKVIRIPRLEADFIPYYLITRNLTSNDEKVAHVLYSSDHDMWQTISEHCYVYFRSASMKTIIKKNEGLTKYIKSETKYPDEYIPLALSIIGDLGDDVYGISGIGPKGFLKVIDEFVKIFGNMKNIYDKIEKGEELFKGIETENKILTTIIEAEIKNKTLSNNLKLVSFELLSRALDSPNSTEMIEKKKHIENVMKTSNITRREAMISALERNGVFLEGTSIDFIYI